jgi:cytochrome c5
MMSTATANIPLWDRPDWSESAQIQEPRSNIYLIDNASLQDFNRKGRLHSLWYPVPVTGLKVPLKPLELLANPSRNPFKAFILELAEVTIDLSSADDLYSYMGLKTYPKEEGEGAYFVPFKNGDRPDERMGITFGMSDSSQYVTASCTACHAESLFGRPVIGLTNKTPRANETFLKAHQIVPKVSGKLLQLATKATNAEVRMWEKARETLQWIGVKRPQVLGLDTSLATVSLSLSKRERDQYATVSEISYKSPRKDILSDFVADSKPMPWFTLKYKNRWLSDGSVVSGNPILTNILWNEVGRGVDLRELEDWVMTPDGQKAVVELTSAVFATTPPRYTDFFGKKSINILLAKRGEHLFNQSCYKCHGTYKKDWDTLETVEVAYPEKTEVKDVGTDPNRWMGMKDFSKELNRLSFSETFNIKVNPQKGYVPPPLVGIWSRWPYFHNNSAPTLCDVLKAPEKRRKSWYVGSPVDPSADFDQICNGFPENAPKSWRTKERFFNTKRPGLSNIGHSKHEYSTEEIRDLVMYLKTL